MFPLELDPYFLSRVYFVRHSLIRNFFECLSSILSENFEVIIHPLPLWSFLILQYSSHTKIPHVLEGSSCLATQGEQGC